MITVTGTYYAGTSPVAGATVSATPLYTPYRQLVNGVWTEQNAAAIATTTASDGTWSLTLPWPSEVSPRTLEWRIDVDAGNGGSYAGLLPDTPTTTVTLAALADPDGIYQWTDGSTAETRVVVPPGPVGPAGEPGPPGPGGNSPEFLISNFASLASAVSTLGASNATLVIGISQTVSSNLTIPSNIAVRFVNGAVIQPASGVTVTLQSMPIAAPRQIFDISLGGTVTFSNCSGEIRPEWWGARAGQDITSALQAAVTAACATNSTVKAMLLTANLSSQITLGPVSPATLFSCNIDWSQFSAITWTGASNSSIFYSKNWRTSTIRNVWVNIPSGTRGVTVFDLDTPVGFASTSQLQFQNCRCNFGTGAAVSSTVGSSGLSINTFSFASSADAALFRPGPVTIGSQHVVIDHINTTTAVATIYGTMTTPTAGQSISQTNSGCVGWRACANGTVSGNQADNIVWIDCMCAGSGPQYGDIAWQNLGPNALLWTWLGGGVSNCCSVFSNWRPDATMSGGDTMDFINLSCSSNMVDFYFYTGGTYNIQGGRFETGQRFLQTGVVGNSGYQLDVFLSGIELGAYNPISGAQITDGILFMLNTVGSVVLSDPCIYGNAFLFDSRMITLNGGRQGALTVIPGSIQASDPFYTKNNSGWTVNILPGGVMLDTTGTPTGTFTASPPAAHASSHEAGGSDRVYYASTQHDTSTRIETFPRLNATTAVGMSNPRLYLMCFTAPTALTITQVQASLTTAGTSPTTSQFALFSVSGSAPGWGNSVTLLAQTDPAVTTLFGTTGLVTGTLNKDASGNPISNYTLTAGQRYAIGILWAGSGTLPQFTGIVPTSNLAGLLPYMGMVDASHSTMPTSLSGLGATANLVWAAVS